MCVHVILAHFIYLANTRNKYGLECVLVSHLSEGPGHSPSLLVHLGAPHHFLPPLKEHQRGQLLGQGGGADLVPGRGKWELRGGKWSGRDRDKIEEKNKEKIWFELTGELVGQTDGQSDRHLRLRNVSISADVHLAKLQPGTVVPAKKFQSLLCNSDTLLHLVVGDRTVCFSWYV